MPEIIPPKGKSKKQQSHDRMRYFYLIGGVIALVRGFMLLIDIAVGLFLVFLGFVAIQYWLTKK